jgi:hypothetical protein
MLSVLVTVTGTANDLADKIHSEATAAALTSMEIRDVEAAHRPEKS